MQTNLGFLSSESNLDIESILKNANLSTAPYLEGKTIDTIHADIFHALSDLEGMTPGHLEESCRKLAGYRYIEKLCDLEPGKGVRWMRKDSLKLTNGGILIRIEFGEKQVKILCKNHNYFIRYAFDDCLSFQKLSVEEQIILAHSINM
jgi:hypothetical protein